MAPAARRYPRYWERSALLFWRYSDPLGMNSMSATAPAARMPQFGSPEMMVLSPIQDVKSVTPWLKFPEVTSVYTVEKVCPSPDMP